MKKTLITLVSIATLSLPLIASADDETSGKRDGKPPRGEGRLAERDGSEAKGKRGERPALPDFSGMSSAEQLTAIKKHMKENPRMAKMVTKRFDKDKNDELSDAELTTAVAALIKRAEAGGEKGGRGKGRGASDAEGGEEAGSKKEGGRKGKGERKQRPGGAGA